MLGPLQKFSMAGKHVLVTGASSGFGAHFSRVLAGAGASSVVLAARRVDKLRELERDLRAAHPECRTVSVQMDVSDEASIQGAFALIEGSGTSAEGDCGKGLLLDGAAINVLVNNAGVGDPVPFLHMTASSFDYVVGTNLRGAVLVAQQAAVHMLRRGVTNGSIINIASIMAQRPGRRHVNYCASKAGLQHASKCMAVELFRKGIRVNCINPGYFVTELNRDYLTSEAGVECVLYPEKTRAALLLCYYHGAINVG
jgi:NAD(P)-dependent dehydrogenase (short-subunit alcohol dehydrogenase family)